MKHLIFMLAALLPMLAFAADENDTTFTVKDKKIVVDVNDDKTVVTVYNKNGYEMSVLPQFCWMAFQQHKIEHIEFFF